MDTELIALREFLATRHPFDQLAEIVLDDICERLEPRRYPASEVVLEQGTRNSHLHVIRSGAVEVLGVDEELRARLGEGDIFGHRSLLGDGIPDTTFRTIEPTLLYRLPQEAFHRLLREHRRFSYFFDALGGERLRGGLRELPSGHSAAVNLMITPVAKIARSKPITTPLTVPVREAAELMSRQRISSLIVTDGGRLAGILTDRDLRDRVVAKGLAYDRPVSEVMTPSPVTVNAADLAYEALLVMARSSFHHLPVLDGERVCGVVTDTDLVQRYSASPLFLIGDVHGANTVEELTGVSKCLSDVLVALVEANVSSDGIGRAVSSVGEAINHRLIDLAIEELGPSPVPFAFLSGGSLARYEQTAHSDQDNCLLLSDDYRAEQHGWYFEKLSRFVCDGLDACGYIYCPGEIMAMTPKWRQPLSVWKRYFDRWIDEPEPKALMHACIFFDLRRLYGDQPLFQELQTYVLEKACSNRIFHAYMAYNALSHQPPLGFFRNFVLVKDGEHDRTLDLKHSGVVPVTDIARVHALASGVPAVNTRERLQAVVSSGALSATGSADLLDALEFIGSVRLQHQARQIREARAPDNFVSPKMLPPFERSHLKDAFAIVRTMQQALSQRYQTARFA